MARYGNYGDTIPFTLLSNGPMIDGCRDFLESSFPVWRTMSRSVEIDDSEYFWSTTTMRFTRTGKLSPARQMESLSGPVALCQIKSTGSLFHRTAQDCRAQ